MDWVDGGTWGRPSNTAGLDRCTRVSQRRGTTRRHTCTGYPYHHVFCSHPRGCATRLASCGIRNSAFSQCYGIPATMPCRM